MPDLHEYVSDRLTHFVGGKKSPEEQYQLLLLIIRSGELKIPNSKIKSLEFDHSNKLSSNQLLKPNCVCFCDIPDVAFEIHMNKYSRFGLSFFRKFVADQGAIPVHYISTASVKKEDILHPPGGHADRSVGESYDEFFADWCSIIFNALHKDQSIP